METVFAISTGLLLYVFAGYPGLLRLLVWLRGPRQVRRDETFTPSVSLVISAFNEAAVIRQKIENALALDWPRDRFEIAVISDASDDGTDEIVGEYADRGVVLMRQHARRGKTAGLNAFVPRLAGEIVVFSDANAMYEADAVRKLVRNFADPEVGCVTGEARYLDAGQAAADVGEHAYWNYELTLKRLETAAGSTVGGDGAIYAIRRTLWRALPENAINDFLNPLQIVAAGYRNVYEPDAVCHEETAGDTHREYRRRVRIVSRSWRAVFQAPQVLNPLRVGFFSVSVLSHKVLRWFSGIFITGVLVSSAVLLAHVPRVFALGVLLPVLLAVALGLLHPQGRRLAGVLAYFFVLNYASLVGVARGTFGRVSGTWSPPRVQVTDAARGWGRPWVRAAVLVGVLALPVAALGWALASGQWPTVALWLSLGSGLVLAWVYAGYPLCLLAWRALRPRPTRSADHQPAVSLIIPAHNEQTVIEEKLRNALALDYPRQCLEILVGSDGSLDRTNEIARRFEASGVRLVAFPERRGKISTMIDVVRQARGDIVVFSDANTMLEASAIGHLVRRFADPQVGSVSGDVVLTGERALLGEAEDLYYRYERWLQLSESTVGSMIGADGALYAIRRELFVRPQPDTILDDMVVPMGVVRAGRRAVFEPGARAAEPGSVTATEEFWRKSRVVAGAVQLVERWPSVIPWWNPQVLFAFISHKLLRWLSPVFALVLFVSSAMLAAGSEFWLAASAALAAFIALGALGCVPAVRRWRAVALAHYFWMVQAAALFGLLRGLLGRQSVQWRRFERSQVIPLPTPSAVEPHAWVRHG